MYQARDLAAMRKEDLWDLPDGPMKVVFDDGVLETTKRATCYSTYFWTYYLKYPKTPALKQHHLGNMQIGSETHMLLLQHVLWDCYDAYEGQIDIEDLSRMAYEATNRVYNNYTYHLDAHVTTISAASFVEVLEHAQIKEANDTVQPNRLSIDRTHAQIERVLMNPRELINNPIAIIARNGLVSMSQILQCVGPRGYLTDFDSQLFPTPILVGFAHGLTKLYQKMIDSRQATKALSFTGKPLQETEYFNRRLQLLAAVLASVTPGDCGSQQYFKWHIEGNDLSSLAGKLYKTEQGLKRLKDSDTHLRGEIIEYRSIFHCLNANTGTVCATCFGDLCLSIPRYTNVGHVSATKLGEMISSKVLMVKHDDKNLVGDGLELSEFDQRYIRAIDEPPSIKLSTKMANKRVILTLNAAEVARLPTIEHVENISDLNVANISELVSVAFTIVGTNKEEPPAVVPVSSGTRYSSMSHELLEYVKQKRWSTDQRGNFNIDLCDWDIELPLFVLPMKNTNMLDYMKTIDIFLKASKPTKSAKQTTTGARKTLLDHDSVESALRELNHLVAAQLPGKINIVHLEVLIRVLMIASREDRDYRIPYPGNKLQWGSFNEVLQRRSLGAAMAYEKHKSLFNDPMTYLVTMRPPHILDPVLMPVGYYNPPALPMTINYTSHGL